MLISGVSEASSVERVSHSRVGLLSARRALLSPLVGTNFLCAYMVFHGLHVARRDPTFMKLLSAIPLFATCEAASLVGLMLGLASTLAVVDHDKLLSRMPKILGVTIVLFTLEIVLFP
jgi:hypothetical protein